MWCMLCEEPYIYVGGIDIFVFTIQTSIDGLQNNTMIIIYVCTIKGNHISQYISYYLKMTHKL